MASFLVRTLGDKFVRPCYHLAQSFGPGVGRKSRTASCCRLNRPRPQNHILTNIQGCPLQQSQGAPTHSRGLSSKAGCKPSSLQASEPSSPQASEPRHLVTLNFFELPNFQASQKTSTAPRPEEPGTAEQPVRLYEPAACIHRDSPFDPHDLDIRWSVIKALKQ